MDLSDEVKVVLSGLFVGLLLLLAEDSGKFNNGLETCAADSGARRYVDWNLHSLVAETEFKHISLIKLNESGPHP